MTKPTGAIPHKGGVRFDVDSLEYRVLSDWIAAGALPPAADDPRLVRLEILPGRSCSSRDDRQPLIVRAHFSDGHVEDVTRWASIRRPTNRWPKSTPRGWFASSGTEKAAIRAWYLSAMSSPPVEFAVCRAASRTDVFATAPRRNFIDEQVLAKLAALNLPPSPPASDAEFIRRAFLDTIGLLPTADEVRAFLADASPDKRDKLIEPLLHRPEFVDYWAYKWSDLLLVNSERSSTKPAGDVGLLHWIRNKVGHNTPWDVLARELVTATGSTLENGAANFFILHKDPARAGRDHLAWPSWACRSTVPSATIIRWKSGRTINITAWRTCSPACAPKTCRGRQPHGVCRCRTAN